jgi:hypothetical protein
MERDAHGVEIEQHVANECVGQALEEVSHARAHSAE